MTTQETPTHKPSPDSGRPSAPATLQADGFGPDPAPPGRRRCRSILASAHPKGRP
jgi:hypothetical protein